jgi:hypothetical protein
MKIIAGQDLLTAEWLDFKGVTTNASIKQDGSLVMGAGFARQVCAALPGFAADAGRIIRQVQQAAQARNERSEDYGLLRLSQTARYWRWFLFQVKRRFSDAASLDVIALSVSHLDIWARPHPKRSWGVNFPGIGCGCLRETDVLPVIETLPDNVFIFKL